MLGCSLARQLASIKSWSQSLQGVSGGFLGPARSYAEPSQVRSYQSGASSSIKRSLVQDLKYRFRYVVITVMSFIFNAIYEVRVQCSYVSWIPTCSVWLWRSGRCCTGTGPWTSWTRPGPHWSCWRSGSTSQPHTSTWPPTMSYIIIFIEFKWGIETPSHCPPPLSTKIWWQLCQLRVARVWSIQARCPEGKLFTTELYQNIPFNK